MNKIILSIWIFLLFSINTVIAQQEKIEFIQFSNLTYSNNELFVQYSINRKTQDSLVIITQKFKLPDSLTTAFLNMIDSSRILNIASNKTVVIDGIPFVLKYKYANDSLTTISGHPSGMTDQERNTLNYFNTLITPYTNYYYNEFRDSLPNGEYFKNSGMANSTSERKTNGIWTAVTDPLFILNGKIISHEKFNELKLEDKKYSLEVLKSPASTAIYGSRAGHGAVIIRSK